MKPTFIILKKDSKIAVAINSQDIKVIHASEPDAGSPFTVTITLSGEEVSSPLTKYALDKMTDELKSRYNIIQVDNLGFRIKREDHKNDIIKIKVPDQGTYWVFPKALRSVRVNGRQVTIDAFGKTIRVSADHAVDNVAAMKLTACNMEEA